MGLVVYKPGEITDGGETQGEYIFAISDKKNPEAQYNTATGKEGYVLDCMKNDGTTVSFTPYTSDAYCIYDNTTGQVELKENSLKLCTVSGTSDKEPGSWCVLTFISGWKDAMKTVRQIFAARR